MIGNKTEESVNEFLEMLDKDINLGPKPIEGKSFNINKISEVLECSDKIAMELFRSPSPFLYDEQDQVYIEYKLEGSDKLERLYITSDKSDSNFDLACKEICNNLPPISYDLECGGYPNRQAEAAALYKVAVINALQEKQYQDRIDKILQNYDFTRWSGSGGFYEFTNLLTVVQEEADSISRVVLMCANLKLIAERVKKDTSYKGILKEEDAEKLRLLSEEDARINFTFNKKYEAATSTKEKIEIGEALAGERAKMLSQDFVTDDIVLLFKIFNLNQNAIPGRAKRIIRNAAGKYIDELTNKGIIQNSELASEFKKKLISRAQKLFLSRMKEIRYKVWSERNEQTDLSSLIPKF